MYLVNRNTPERNVPGFLVSVNPEGIIPSLESDVQTGHICALKEGNPKLLTMHINFHEPDRRSVITGCVFPLKLMPEDYIRYYREHEKQSVYEIDYTHYFDLLEPGHDLESIPAYAGKLYSSKYLWELRTTIFRYLPPEVAKNIREVNSDFPEVQWFNLANGSRIRMMGTVAISSVMNYPSLYVNADVPEENDAFLSAQLALAQLRAMQEMALLPLGPVKNGELNIPQLMLESLIGLGYDEGRLYEEVDRMGLEMDESNSDLGDWRVD